MKTHIHPDRSSLCFAFLSSRLTAPCMRKYFPLCICLAGFLVCGGTFLPPGAAWPLQADEAVAQTATSRTILDVNPEDRDVGLKRMEILDRSLTPELIRKKNAFIRMKEDDYNRKIAELVQRLTTPIGRNTVITHIDVNFFDPGFEQQVQAEEKVSVTILLDGDGFAKWSSGKGSEDAAKGMMQDLVSSTFKIPRDQVSIVTTPN